MASGLLSLKWNNHRSTFFHVLSTIRSKESYCDVTLACDGRFYSLHKFVLSTCSEYFEEMFERTSCKHPVIVLKDIRSDDLEALLNYMYVGEVNVVQEKLAGLIKAAECLKIKGLAVPDEDPIENKSIGREQNKRSQRSDDSPRPKKRRRENSLDVADEILSPIRSRPTARSREVFNSSNSTHETKNTSATSEDNRHNEGREDGGDLTALGLDTKDQSESLINDSRPMGTNSRNNRVPSSQKGKSEPVEVILDDDVKHEPLDPPPDELPEEDEGGGGDGDNDADEKQDSKEALHQELGYDGSDAMGGADDNYDDMDSSMLGNQPQNMEDVVAQAMPGSSGFQENSFPMWEGEGSLSNFPVEGFSGDNSQARQMDLLLSPSSSSAAAAFLSAHIVAHAAAMTDLDGKDSTDCASSGQNQSLSNTAFNDASSSNTRYNIGITDTATTSYSSDNMRSLNKLLNTGIQPNINTSVSNLVDSSQCYSVMTTMDSNAPTPTLSTYLQCQFCQYRTASTGSMKAHSRVHTGERPFPCTFCNYRATQQQSLKSHMRTHTGEKPHCCPHCNYRSTHRHHIKRHVATWHSQNTENSS